MQKSPGADAPPRGHRLLAHTADAGFEVTAPTLGDVYAEAALALFDLMGRPVALAPEAPFDVEASGVDREDLLVRLLSELLAHFELSGRFVTAARCVSVGLRGRGDWHVLLRCEGGRIDVNRERRLAAVKAVTYHGLSIREEGRGFHARAFVDV